MFTMTGAYESATVYTDQIEPSALSQIQHILSQPWAKDTHIRIMPDVHAGTGCVIGTTMHVTDKVVPNLVGVDIGCGMRVARLSQSEIDLPTLDEAIKSHIPMGAAKRPTVHRWADRELWATLRCANEIKLDAAAPSLGTLGGGNHFIEIDRDSDDRLWLVIHTGSRQLGLQVATFYQKQAMAICEANGGPKNCELAYLEGQMLDDYLHDMSLAQGYARRNRDIILDEILSANKLTVDDEFESVHNYIDLQSMILRKGATDASAGTRALIPLNMRDGSLITIGRGNPEWNDSAPHGAGRKLSRSEAKSSISLEEYSKSMQGIYSSSVKRSTLDESPMAYKDASNIVDNIAETAEISDWIKPVYNCKAS
jgi:RNA-splicing ligase RtcB